MAEMTPFLYHFMLAAMCLLGCVIVLCLVRAILGPRFTDRIVALNMIGSVVTIVIGLLSYVLGEGYLADVAILYALLNMIAVIILCRVAHIYHRERDTDERGGTGT